MEALSGQSLLTASDGFISPQVLELQAFLLGNDSFQNASYSNGSDVGAANDSALADGGDEQFTDALVMGVTSVILGLMILVTIIGNVFVIAAILLERNLQNVANYLIVSLAVADLMVACLVMPLGAVYRISKDWILGPELCDMWTSSDVLCCTASILHLVAIAVDRYWAVTNVDYIHTRNSSRIGGMIVVVWAVALIVSLAPQFGWKDPDYLIRINVEQRCLVSQDVAYQIFATCSTFYVPLLVILVLYWKIFQTARKRIHRRRQQRPTASTPAGNSRGAGDVDKATSTPAKFLCKRRFRRLKSSKKSSAAEALVSSLVLVEGQSSASVDAADGDDDAGATHEDKVSDSGRATDAVTAGLVTTAFTISKSVEQCDATSNNVSPEKSSATTTNNGSASHQSHMSDMSRAEILQRDGGGLLGRTAAAMVGAVAASGAVLPATSAAGAAQQPRRDKKESLEAKRERKAAKTLAIITGAFVVCWLPFFIMALLMPLCEACSINEDVSSFFLWLGYFNSTLNPVIYTIFSPEFRQAFKRILCGAGGRGGRSNFRPGKLR